MSIRLFYNNIFMIQYLKFKLFNLHVCKVVLIAFILLLPGVTAAATLQITPDTGVFSIGQTVTARVTLNTSGAMVNAAEAQISYDPSLLEVRSVTQTGSIFNLWAEEPSVSAGQIRFSGGAPTGFNGNGGTVVTITFVTRQAGTARISFQDGSVLAADGRGSNVLNNMLGASYTIQAPQSTPVPEVIEYVPAPNTPPAPNLSSPTHPDQDSWYASQSAVVEWTVPSGVTQVRTALTQRADSVPDSLAETIIDSISLSSLPDGVSYLHVQFRNADGWGRIARYRLAVSTSGPSGLSISLADSTDMANPVQELVYSVASSTAPLQRALVQIDGGDPIEYKIESATGTIALPELEPGYRIVMVEVVDEAGNSTIERLSFTIESFAAPVLRDVPDIVAEGTAPVFYGTTRADAVVMGRIRDVGNDTIREYKTTSDSEGQFRIIPDRPLSSGIFEVSAFAIDTSGARSEVSIPVRFIVQPPGYIQLGSYVVSVLSVIVPLLALLIVTILLTWYGFLHFRRLRKSVQKESYEAHDVLSREFALLQELLNEHERALQNSRKTKKLTKAEATLIEEMRLQLQTSLDRVGQEITDVEELVSSSASDER